MNQPSILDMLTAVQAAPNIRVVETEALFRCITYWTTVTIRQERNGRDKQAVRLRANIAEMKHLAVELAVLRTLCVFDPVARRRSGKIVAVNVPHDPDQLAWLLDWLAGATPASRKI